MNWIILVLISVVTITVSRLLQRALLKDEQSNPILFSMFFQLFVGILFFIFTLTRGFNFEGYQNYLPTIILMGFLYAFGGAFLSKAFKLTEASTVALLFTTTTVWAFFGAIIFFGERPGVNQLLGITLIVSAVIIINFKKDLKSVFSKFSKGELYALIAGAFFGIAFLTDAYNIGTERDLTSYLVIAFLLPGSITALIYPKEIKNIPVFLKAKTVFNTLIIAFFYSLSAFSIFAAYQNGGDASVINPMSQLSTILIILSSIVIFKEKDLVLRKVICGIIALIGLVLISLA